ncbi:MAG: DUF354 domain-containing protein [Haloferacaceae archaeon]
MRYLVFTNTPAHVHLYKHVVDALRDRGHDVLVLGRDYGCTVDLLSWYGLPHEVYGRCGTTTGSLLRNLPRQYLNIVRAARRFDPDLIFGMGSYAAHAGAVVRSPVILVLDSEPTSLDHALSRPFARAVLTPEAFRRDLGANHYVFSGFKESAYLHPDVFEAAADVREALGVPADEPYALVRFNAFGSHHDVGQSGFAPAQRRELVERLAERGRVFVSDEGGQTPVEDLPAEPFDCHPARIHDVLAEASLLVADTQTMVTEAALLGTPAIRSNSFVGEDDMGNFLALERAGLVRNLSTFEAVLTDATDLFADPAAAADWERRRDEFVREMVNLTDLLVEVAQAPSGLDRVEGLRRR